MEHVASGDSLVKLLKTRKLIRIGTYKDLVNLLANYKGTWEEVLDVALILKEDHVVTNKYLFYEKEFIDQLVVKGEIDLYLAQTTLKYLDEFLKESGKSRNDLLRDIKEMIFPDTKDTFLISQYAKTVEYVVNKTNYLDFIDNLKEFKKNPKNKEAVINLIILLNCDSGWTDGELEDGLMPLLHDLSKGDVVDLPEFTDLYKGANKTKKQAMLDIKKALGITIKKSHKELLYELVDSLTEKDFSVYVADTNISLEDNIRNFSLAAKELNKGLLLQSFYNMCENNYLMDGVSYTYEEILKGFLYTLCNVGTRRDLIYILDRAELKETKVGPPTPVKKPEVKPIELLWMEDGNLNYKYFVDEPFISAAAKKTNKKAKPDKKAFVYNLWLLWLYRNTKEHDVNKIKGVLLNLYKELGTIESFSVHDTNMPQDIKNFMVALDYKKTNSFEIVLSCFKQYVEEVKPDLLDIPKEVLEHIVSMRSYEKCDVLPDLRSDSVTKIANVINMCAVTPDYRGFYTLIPKAFISSYYSKELTPSSITTSEAYSKRLANFIREINNPEGLKELFKSTLSDSTSLHKLHLEGDYNMWKVCKEVEETVKKALEENLSKKIEEPVTTPSVDYALPYTIEDVNVTKELLSLEGTSSGRVSCGSPNNTSPETSPLSSDEVLPETCPVAVEPEKPNENQKRLEDYKHGLYLGVIKESISSLRQIVSDMYLKDKTIIQLLNTSVGDAILSALLAELLPFILGESHKDKIDFIVKLLKENSMFLIGEMSMKFLFGAGKELNRLKENIELMSLLKETVAV